MLKKKIPASLLVGLMAVAGLGSGIAIIASAQSAATVAPANTTVQNQTVDTPEPGDVADTLETESVDTPEAGDVADVAGEHADKAGDKDGGAASEDNEPAGGTDAGE